MLDPGVMCVDAALAATIMPQSMARTDGPAFSISASFFHPFPDFPSKQQKFLVLRLSVQKELGSMALTQCLLITKFQSFLFGWRTVKIVQAKNSTVNRGAETWPMERRSEAL